MPDFGLSRRVLGQIWAFLGDLGPDFGLFRGFWARYLPIQGVCGQIVAYGGGLGTDLALFRGFVARFGPI